MHHPFAGIVGVEITSTVSFGGTSTVSRTAPWNRRRRCPPPIGMAVQVDGGADIIVVFWRRGSTLSPRFSGSGGCRG